MPEFSHPSEIAREALRRLAIKRLQPTPDNYQSLYHEIAGTAAAEPFPERGLKSLLAGLPRSTPEQARVARQIEVAIAEQSWGSVKTALVSAVREKAQTIKNWSGLIRELHGEFERRQAGYTAGRKREALDHVLTKYASDPDQLFQRLQSLVKSWAQAPTAVAEPLTELAPEGSPTATSSGDAEGVQAELREVLAQILKNSVGTLLNDAPELADEANQIAEQIRQARDKAAVAAVVARVKKFVFRLQWVAEDQVEVKASLLHLLKLIVDNISELIADDQWLHGQLSMLNDLFSGPLTVRRLDDIERRLKDVIFRQGALKHDLDGAKDKLKALLAGFVDHLSRFTASTSEYQDKMGRCAGRISQAKDIAELSDLVEELIRDTRAMELGAERSRGDLESMKTRVEEAEREISRLQVELAQTSELVRLDQLTGTLNRKGLEEALGREMSRARRRNLSICVGLLDVDNFKALNDTYGHQAGDDALVHLAQVIRETLRPQDTVARYGGEEFVVLLPDTELEDGANVMTRLQRALTARFFLHNNERLLITFSAGVARIGPEESPETALRRADSAMYQAKKAGKNRVIAVQ